MKRNTHVLAAVAGLLVTLSVPMCAQRIRLKADIPFEFMVNGKVMPAGTYRIEEQPGDSGRRNVVAVIDEARRRTAVFLTQPETSVNVQDQARLLFTHYGSRYFLSQIWDMGSNEGLRVLQSRAERELVAGARASGEQRLVILARR